MITAFSFRKAQGAIEAATQIVSVEMPKARFVLVGVDNDYIYFNVVARHPSVQEIQNLKEKTGFELVFEDDRLTYKANFKMALN